MTDALALDTRSGLPDALRVLLGSYPREAWETDPQFGGLVRFWLERHLTFRRLTALLADDGERLLDRAIDPAAYGQRLARLGSMLVDELHGHHLIEDAHYFPVLARTEPQLLRGFEMLERDHQALDHHLAAFADAANGLIGLVREGVDAIDAGAGFLWHLAGLEQLLDRHLVDEEELVVPVVLKHGERGLL